MSQWWRVTQWCVVVVCLAARCALAVPAGALLADTPPWPPGCALTGGDHDLTSTDGWWIVLEVATPEDPLKVQLTEKRGKPAVAHTRFFDVRFFGDRLGSPQQTCLDALVTKLRAGEPGYTATPLALSKLLGGPGGKPQGEPSSDEAAAVARPKPPPFAHPWAVTVLTLGLLGCLLVGAAGVWDALRLAHTRWRVGWVCVVMVVVLAKLPGGVTSLRELDRALPGAAHYPFMGQSVLSGWLMEMGIHAPSVLPALMRLEAVLAVAGAAALASVLVPWERRRAAATAAAWLTALSPLVLKHTLGAGSGVLLAALAGLGGLGILAWWQGEDHRWRWGWLVTLSVAAATLYIRPEGLGLCAVCAAAVAMGTVRRHRWGPGLLWFALFALAAVPHAVQWQTIQVIATDALRMTPTLGEAAPVTDTPRGPWSMWWQVRQLSHPPFLILASTLLLLWGLLRRPRLGATPALLLAGVVAFVGWVSPPHHGTFWYNARYLVPAAPLLAVLVTVGLHAAGRRLSWFWLAPVLAVCTALASADVLRTRDSIAQEQAFLTAALRHRPSSFVLVTPDHPLNAAKSHGHIDHLTALLRWQGKNATVVSVPDLQNGAALPQDAGPVFYYEGLFAPKDQRQWMHTTYPLQDLEEHTVTVDPHMGQVLTGKPPGSQVSVQWFHVAAQP